MFWNFLMGYAVLTFTFVAGFLFCAVLAGHSDQGRK